MRSILFTIPLNGHVDFGPLGVWPVFGAGLLLGLWMLFGAWVLYRIVREVGWKEFPYSAIVIWLIVAVAIHEVPRHIQAIPVYGYGTMLFLGFLTSASVAARRLRKQGLDGEIAWDAAMWMFVA